MEVLISIGILAVGLSAVVALIPAGGSEAQRALAEDRKANMGLAALDDAIARGILRPPATPPFVVDPLGTASSGIPNAVLPSVSLGNLAAGSLAADTVFRSEDDVVYSLDSSGEDDPPLPVYFGGNAKRASDGTYSWLATLVPVVPGDLQNFRLSVVTFHSRGDRTPVLLASVSLPNTVTFAWGGSATSFRKTFPRSSVVLLHDDGGTPLPNRSDDTWEWRRVIFGSLDENNGQGQLMFASGTSVDAVTTTMYAFEGAVGVAERIVRLEGDSPWSQ